MDLENLKHQVRFGCTQFAAQAERYLGTCIRALAGRERG
jgi:hypothetical protein